MAQPLSLFEIPQRGHLTAREGAVEQQSLTWRGGAGGGGVPQVCGVRLEGTFQEELPRVLKGWGLQVRVGPT